MEYRKHLQAFIDRWRYNANRGAFSFLLSLPALVLGLMCEGMYSRAGTVEDQNSGEGMFV